MGQNYSLKERIEEKRKKNPFINNSTLVYEMMLEDIVSGLYKPGTKINQEEIASQFNVSRSPVRDAVNRLEADGYIIKSSKSGLFIYSLIPQDFIDLNDYRIHLEVLGVRLTAMNIDKSGIEKLKSNMENIKKAIEDDNIDLVLKLDEDFHDIIIEESKNKYLIETYNFYKNKFKFFRTMIVRSQRFHSIYKRHKKIYTSIIDRNEEEAEKAIKAHLGLTLNHALKAVEEFEDIK